jgi:hypothetical protein
MNYRILLVVGTACAVSSLVTAPAKAQGLLDLGRMIIGLPAEEKDPIDYRARAPLVVPPGQTLRPPQEAVAPDQRRANWPQDPDVLERRKAAEEARKPKSIDTVVGRDGTPVRRMTVQEIRAGRVAGQEVVTTPQQLQDERSRANVYGGLSALREMDKSSAQSRDTSGNLSRDEPRREFLTEPPTGLRRAADNAPYRATREGSLGVRKEPSPYDIFKEEEKTR